MCGKILPVLNFQLMPKQKSGLSLCEQMPFNRYNNKNKINLIMQGNVLWILLSQDVLHKFMSHGKRTSAVHHLEVTDGGKKRDSRKVWEYFWFTVAVTHTFATAKRKPVHFSCSRHGVFWHNNNKKKSCKSH